MKPNGVKKLTRMLTIAALILTGATLGRQAGADPAVTYSYALASTPSPDPTCSTDLVNNGQSTLSSVTDSGNVTQFGGSLTYVNDGVYGDGSGSSGVNPDDGTTVTFTLYTTNHPDGYDIKQIVSYAGFSDGRRAYQYYDVAVHTVGSAPGTFVTLSSVNYLGYTPGYGAPEWTQVNIGDGTNVMASGVDQIQFTFHSSPWGYAVSIYREIDVFGAPLPTGGTVIYVK